MTPKAFAEASKNGDTIINNLPKVNIVSMTMSLFSDAEIRRSAECVVDTVGTMQNGNLDDARMGVTDNFSVCKTCNRNILTCRGHHGVIELVEPFINPYLTIPLFCVISSICNSCSKLLISKSVIEANGIDKLKGSSRLRAIKELAIKCTSCTNKQAGRTNCPPNPTYSVSDMKDSPNILFKYKITVHEDQTDEENTNSTGKKVKPKSIRKVIDNERKISDVIKIFEKISKEDLQLLGFSGNNHPINLIMRSMVVMPPTMRPSCIQDGEPKRDYYTVMYENIITINNKLKNRELNEKEYKDLVKKQYMLIIGILIGSRESSAATAGFKDKSIKKDVGTKKGYVRHHTMSKRGDYLQRSVLGPGSKLPQGFIGLPEELSKITTTPEVVTNYNLGQIRQLYSNGYITGVTPKGTLTKINVNEINHLKLFPSVGDTVERFLLTGDQVTFNRQPTLHRQSMAGLRAILHGSLTNRIHSSDTVPTNADYDGDEGNVFPHRSLGTKCENMFSSDYSIQIANGQKYGAMIAIVYHGLLGAHMLVEDEDIDDEDMEEAMKFFYVIHDDPYKMRTWEARLKKYGIKKNTGRALFSALFPPSLTVVHKGLDIREGIVVSGSPNKGNIGVGDSIVYHLYNFYSPKIAQNFITEAQWLFDWYIVAYGFSLSMSDIPGMDCSKPEELGIMQKRIAKEVEDVERKIEMLGVPDPNEPIHVSIMREIKTYAYLDTTNNFGKEITDKYMGPKNSFRLMANSGAKGSVANIAAVCGLLGQQMCSGKRPALNMCNNTRHLPYFEKNKKYVPPTSRGFVKTNYMVGVEMPDMFIHFASSRDGLIDASLKTASVGFMFRKLTKITDDISIWADGSVRRSNGSIIMFNYGAGISSMNMVKTKSPRYGERMSFTNLQKLADNC